MGTSQTSKRPIAVTMGDPAGVGPLLVEAALAQSSDRRLPQFEYLYNPKVKPVPGHPDVKNAAAVIASIEAAVKGTLAGKYRAVVTCPIHKKSLMDAGFRHSGHTGLLGALTGAAPVMMLAAGDFRVVPVTVHLPLKEVPKALTKSLLIETIRITAKDLQDRFKIQNPRLAVTGLNPHAGEEGKLGLEEQKVIIPALKALGAEGFMVDGPLPADTAFTQTMRIKYDCFFAMTHDQALIPVKTLDFRGAVNITLGLPIIRTSPAHGTAFDLVREGRTPDPESFIQALIMADQLSR